MTTQAAQEQLPEGVSAITFYQVNLASDYFFPTVSEAQSFLLFRERISEIYRSLPIPEGVDTAERYHQHDARAVAEFDRHARALVKEFDREGRSYSALMKKDMLLGAAVLLESEAPRGPLVAQVVLRLARIDINDREWFCALGEVPEDVRRDRTLGGKRKSSAKRGGDSKAQPDESA